MTRHLVTARPIRERDSSVYFCARCITAMADAVMGLADVLGLRAFHSTDSRRDTAAGFPDLVLVGNRVLFVELKRQDGRVRPEQRAWLGALTAAEGVTAVVWRPSSLLDGTIQTTLRGMRA